MAQSVRFLRWICWALVAFVVVSAIFQLGITLRFLVTDPVIAENTDFVDRLAAFRTMDQTSNTIYLLSNLATVSVFLLATMLGVALRPFAGLGSAKDVMATIFVVGGVIGIIAALLNIGVNEASTFGYCDCGYRTEEIIAQDYALGVGWNVQMWLALGAITIVGIGAALAGWLVDISPAWRWLSYAIAIGLLVGVVLQIARVGNTSNLLVSAIAGIAVPIWAVLLARGVRAAHETVEVVPA